MSTALVRYEAARQALTDAVMFDEVMSIMNVAEQAALYAKQANDTELVEKATEIKVRAQRKAGEMLIQAADQGQRATKAQHGRGIQSSVVTSDTRPTLAQMGLTRDESSRYQKLAAMPEEHFEAAVQTAKAVAGQVTTAFMLRQASTQTATPPRSSARVEELPIDEVPERAVPPLTAANRLIDALELLASLPYSPAELRDALPSYQHHRVTKNIDAAMAALREVRQSWTKAAA